MIMFIHSALKFYTFHLKIAVENIKTLKFSVALLYNESFACSTSDSKTQALELHCKTAKFAPPSHGLSPKILLQVFLQAVETTPYLGVIDQHFHVTSKTINTQNDTLKLPV